MLNKIKKIIRIFLNWIGMFSEFYLDYREYKRWNYNNIRVKTQDAIESKILRHTHMIEKGMSLSNPRKGFGQDKIKELFVMLDEYIKLDFPTKDVPFQNAICVLNQYIALQMEMGYENQDLNERLSEYNRYLTEDFVSELEHISLSELEKDIHGNFSDFFNSRHSVRQFSERTIYQKDIIKAVELARKAPTACNRQPCKVYFYDDETTNQQLGKLIAGNTGFDDEVKNYLVITSNLSAFYNTFERNQIYIEAGIFSLALIEALHYYGIASCLLQNGEYYKKNQKFKSICGNIPESEKIVLFIAIGYYKNEFKYAVSKRKEIDNILIMR